MPLARTPAEESHFFQSPSFRALHTHTHTHTQRRARARAPVCVSIYRDNRTTSRRHCVALSYSCTLIRIRFIVFSMHARVRIRCISDASSCQRLRYVITTQQMTCILSGLSINLGRSAQKLEMNSASVIYYAGRSHSCVFECDFAYPSV